MGVFGIDIYILLVIIKKKGVNNMVTEEQRTKIKNYVKILLDMEDEDFENFFKSFLD